MKILVACEESQRVTNELRRLGHEAYSCDIIEESGGHPEWHIQHDVLELINGSVDFTTNDKKNHSIIGEWDMIIAFPPCTHLALSGARHFEGKRADGRQREGIELFAKILRANCNKIAVENPVNIINGEYIKTYFPDLCDKYNLPQKATQKIQPYYFGDNAKKTTCLWLKNLPKLEPTNIVEPDLIQYHCSDGRTVTFSRDYCQGLNGERAKSRSKTYMGVAKAMAEQWTK